MEEYKDSFLDLMRKKRADRDMMTTSYSLLRD